MFEVVKILVFALQVVKFTEACNGFHLKVDHIKTCLDNSVAQPQNMNFTLDKDCNIVYSGCVDFTKTIKTAKGTYEITKAPMPTITGEIDMCDMVSNTKFVHLTQVLKGFGLPKKCPVAAKKYCVNGKKTVNISSFKAQLPMALGTTEAKLNVDHDSGKTCVEIRMTLSKKK